jgi:hypothetical protein
MPRDLVAPGGPGQRFVCRSGQHYGADEQGVLHDILPQDEGELLAHGCTAVQSLQPGEPIKGEGARPPLPAAGDSPAVAGESQATDAPAEKRPAKE